jgi:CheY-like chemotaxis protein
VNFRSTTQIFNQTDPPPSPNEESSSSGKKKILLVEDNIDVRKLLVILLKNSGYETIEAATGIEALTQAHATCPDLIIMDLGMPAMTGDQATARLKADPLTSHIPVVVITAFSYGTLVDRARAVGAADILYKPFHFESLHATLQRHLSVNHQPKQLDTLEPDAPSAASPSKRALAF